jgi:hypothetical protein
MKTYIKTILLLAFLPGGIFYTGLFADPPLNPPPPPAGGHGGGNNQPPAGAPIDGGLGVLFILGAVFGGLKMYKNRAGQNQNPR